MNAHAGIRHGGCMHRDCNTCAAYTYAGTDGWAPQCRCGHAQRWHAQVRRDRPLVTTANWMPGAA